MNTTTKNEKLPKFVRRLYIIVGLLCGIALLIQSCKKDSNPEPNPEPKENTLVFSPVPVFMGVAPVDNDVKLQRSVILFNSGSESIQVDDYSISGTIAGAFKITNSPKKTIGPVESVVIEMEYNPSVSGEETAALKVSSDRGTITDNVSGKGTTGSDNIEFYRIYSLQDQEGLSYGIEPSDGGLIFIGTNLVKDAIEHTDVKVMKTDKYGARIWEKTYGGEFSDSPSRIVEVSNGYIIGGTTESYDDYAQLDFTCSYAFNKHFELFVNGNNLTNAVTREYFQVKDRPRVNQFVGTSFLGGIRYTL